MLPAVSARPPGGIAAKQLDEQLKADFREEEKLAELRVKHHACMTKAPTSEYEPGLLEQAAIADEIEVKAKELLKFGAFRIWQLVAKIQRLGRKNEKFAARLVAAGW